MDQINHRLANISDESMIQDLLASFFTETKAKEPAHGQDYKAEPEKLYLKKLPLAQNGKKYRYYVCEMDGKIIALLILFIKEKIFYENSDTGFIDCAITRSNYRNKGIMTSLLSFIYDKLAKEGILTFELNVLYENQKAYKFWEKHGFHLYSCNLMKITEKEKF